MRQIRNFLAAGLMAAGAVSAQAETLTDVLVSAYNNSNILELNRAALRAADEDVAIALSALRPIIGYSASRTHSIDLDTELVPDGLGGTRRQDAENITDTLALTAQLSLFEFGRNRLAVKAADEVVLATRFNLLGQEQSVLFAAVQGYTAVRRAQEFVTLRQNNVRVLEEELRAANDRFAVGEVTRTDVAQAEAALAQSEARLVSARGDLEASREQFKLAVGRYPGNLVPPPSFPRRVASLTQARSIAVTTHPSVQQLQHAVKAQEINVVIAEREVLPNLSLNGSFNYSNRSSLDDELEPDASASIQLSGPIYQGGQINALYRKTVAQLDQNKANLLQTTQNVEERVGFGWASLQSAAAALQATDRQIEAARVAFEGTREEATLGARTTLDVLNAEQDLLDAQAARIDALTTEQDAYYFLLSTMGLLTAEKLELEVVAFDPDAYYAQVRGAPPVFTSEQGIKLDRVLKGLGRAQ